PSIHIITFPEMKKILKFVLWGLAALVGVGLLGLGYLLFFLPNVPVEDIKVEVTPQRVERDKYLATHVTV
ncbi:hypothetical protein L0P10_20700, partial [Eggerthella lenta]|nr:hypothetical protein [Eggerthella lenta]